MNPTRVEKIRERLSAAFSTDDIVVRDNSHKHAGHAGARDGRGHFAVRIVSDAFQGLTQLQRHRAVFAALGEMMRSDIHALEIDAATALEKKTS